MDSATHLPRPDARWALFLDVDGTLVEFAPTPDAVKVGRRLVDLLDRLNATLGGAVALVSGRPIAKLDELFAPLRLPAAGNHGLERRDMSGNLTAPGVEPASLDPVRSAFERFADENIGIVVEDKGASVALHYRLAPEAAAAVESLADDVLRDLGPGFRIQRGKMLVELRPDGADKGSAIESFMADPPFAGRVPVFIGDDVTDEDGFAAVNRMGGFSIRVGRPNGSVAGWRVADIGAVLDWLELIATGSRVQS
ncbi:MAG: trehalose-phosphatase [Alphaproteobacteria bacterium]